MNFGAHALLLDCNYLILLFSFNSLCYHNHTRLLQTAWDRAFLFIMTGFCHNRINLCYKMTLKSVRSEQVFVFIRVLLYFLWSEKTVQPIKFYTNYVTRPKVQKSNLLARNVMQIKYSEVHTIKLQFMLTYFFSFNEERQSKLKS